MQFLLTDWLSILILAFVLGIKHGLDADHLAIIDGLTRYNARSNPRLARFCGTLFSLGHGIVVLIVALGVSTLAAQWTVPNWFDVLGSLISIIFLVGLGCLNLAAVLRAQPDEIVQPVGFKGHLLHSLQRASNPLPVALVGTLFAISFDTMSQAVFFALAATRYGGWQHAFLLASAFLLGMMVTDGLGGLWIARLIARADQAAVLASHVMGLIVAGVSFLVGGFGLIKLLSPTVDAWSSGKELFFSASLIVFVAGGFFLAIRLSRGTRVVVHLGHY